MNATFYNLIYLTLWVIYITLSSHHLNSFTFRGILFSFEFFLLPSGSYNQKLLNCLIDASLQKETSCLMNCSHVTAPTTVLFSFPLGLWFLRGQQIFLSGSSWVSSYLGAILFWYNFKQKSQEVSICLLSRLIHQLFTFCLIWFIILLHFQHAHRHTHKNACTRTDVYANRSF